MSFSTHKVGVSHVQCSNSEDEVGDDLAKIREAMEYITREPLEAKGVDSANIPTVQGEVKEIVLYAGKYLSIGSEGYQKICYKLHTSPDVVQ